MTLLDSFERLYCINCFLPATTFDRFKKSDQITGNDESTFKNKRRVITAQ